MCDKKRVDRLIELGVYTRNDNDTSVRPRDPPANSVNSLPHDDQRPSNTRGRNTRHSVSVSGGDVDEPQIRINPALCFIQNKIHAGVARDVLGKICTDFYNKDHTMVSTHTHSKLDVIQSPI